MGKLFIKNLAVGISIFITLQFGLIQYFTTHLQFYNTVVEEVVITQKEHLTKDNIGNNGDMCNFDYWKSSIEQDDEILTDLVDRDLGFLYFLFSQNGNLNAHKNGKRDSDRGNEALYSTTCLEKALPTIPHKTEFLGDFADFAGGMAAISDWAVFNTTWKGNFIMDADIFADPKSQLSVKSLIAALSNVDIAISRNPNRQKKALSLQSGIVAYRNTRRSKLFHQCVSQVLKTGKFGGVEGITKQQPAMEAVLDSPLGQFVRVNYLEPEFHCYISKPTLRRKGGSNAFNVVAPVLKDSRQCYFRHSHGMVLFLTKDCEDLDNDNL